MKEIIYVAEEIAKNLLMSNPFIVNLRIKRSAGRTAGVFDIDKIYEYCLGVYDQYCQGLKDANFPDDYLKGKAIMEIGPGAHLGVEVCFAANGAKKADALDRFPVVQSRAEEKELYQRLLAHFKDTSPDLSTVINLEGETPRLHPDTIRYYGGASLESASTRADLKDYDMAVSHLALEHVADLDKGLLSVSKILKPGGICIFICNLVSLGGVYNHQKEPLRLLYYSDFVWNLMFSNRGGSNRVRASGYKKLLEKYNFEVLSFKVLQEMNEAELVKIKPAFDKQFRELSNDDLKILRFRIVGRLKA